MCPPSWDAAVRNLTVSAEPVIATGTHALGDQGMAGCCLLSSPSLGRLLVAWCPSATARPSGVGSGGANKAAAVVNLAVLLNRLDDDGKFVDASLKSCVLCFSLQYSFLLSNSFFSFLKTRSISILLVKFHLCTAIFTSLSMLTNAFPTARRARLHMGDNLDGYLSPYLPSTKRFLRALGARQPAAVLAAKRIVACREALLDVGNHNYNHHSGGAGGGGGGGYQGGDGNALRGLQRAMDELSEGRAELAAHKDAQVHVVVHTCTTWEENTSLMMV